MKNDTFVLPFKNLKGYLQIYHDKKCGLNIITISNENEILTITNLEKVKYIDNSNKEWRTQDLISFSTQEASNNS